MAKTKDKILRFELQRKDKEVIFYLKIPKEIEDFFKNACGDKIEKSTYWLNKEGKGQDFYKLSEDMKHKLDSFGFNVSFINEYGNGLLAENSTSTINIAPLRTIGTSKGIWLHCSNLGDRNIDFEYYLRELGYFAKELYQNLIANKKVKAEIVFEL